jgi:hypothetical protein
MAANTKSTWFDETSNASLIADQAQRLESFIHTMADGKVTDDEVKAQEQLVVKLMKEIEPQLDAQLHERVTQLLAEITAYDMMQSLNMMQSARPMSKFRG